MREWLGLKDLLIHNRPPSSAHIAELECQISNLSGEIERQSGGLLDQRDAAVDLRQRLKHLLETS